MSRAIAIMFDDTMVVVRDSSRTIGTRCYFTKLVHVVSVQYRGPGLFIDRYLRAFAAVGMDYEQNDFGAGSLRLAEAVSVCAATPFSVKAEVLRRERDDSWDQMDE